MFICKNCKSIDKFELLISPDYTGNQELKIRYNSRDELEISVDGYTFIPDLRFMNEHAVCKYCGQIYTWDYSFLKNKELER